MTWPSSRADSRRAEPTAEPTAEVTEEAGPTVEEAVDAVDVCFDVRGASAAVAACAGRENSSKTTKIPAATSAACIAARAMRRTTGCDMSSSTRRETGPPAYPPAAATNHARPDLLFGHHRTVLSPIEQGPAVAAKERNVGMSATWPWPPPDCWNQVALYQERAWQESHRASRCAGGGIEYVLVKPLMGTSHSDQSGGERVNVLDLSQGQFGAAMVRYFVLFGPIGVWTGFPVAGFETART